MMTKTLLRLNRTVAAMSKRNGMMFSSIQSIVYVKLLHTVDM